MVMCAMNEIFGIRSMVAKDLRVALAVAILCTGPVFPAAAAIQRVNVVGGTLEGRTEDGVTSFKGVPFAAPPVGELRWKAPQAVIPWSGIKKADAFALPCAQRQSDGVPDSSEDCLYLNVWTGAESSSEKRPVMVWIYGGAFMVGSTADPIFDGRRFAKEGVVLVSIAYRLGAFGFLAHPELDRESGKASGNYGLQDEIAALEWVKSNITQFGGDPSRVTTFGESAGGISVSLLAGTPAAKGLFQGAISASGGVFSHPWSSADPRDQTGPAPLRTLKLAESIGIEFLRSLGAATLEQARAVPAEDVVRAAAVGDFGFWPVLDGAVLPDSNFALYPAKQFNDTPVLIGSNSDEGAGFISRDATTAMLNNYVRSEACRTQGESLLSLYPIGKGTSVVNALEGLYRDGSYAWNTWTWARLQSTHGRGKVYLYYFDVRTPASPNGAHHGDDVAYVFGNFDIPGKSAANVAPRSANLRVSDLIRRYWINFASNGDPNGPGLPVWPTFREGAQRAMVFDHSPGARSLPNMARLKAFDSYYSCLWKRNP